MDLHSFYTNPLLFFEDPRCSYVSLLRWLDRDLY
jgi:hypothetical protein